MTFISIANRGQAIASTNYWDMEHAKAGLIFLSWNAGAGRVLIPDVQKPLLRQMKGAKSVIVSGGPWPDRGGRDAWELMWEDYSEAPFAIHLLAEQSDRLLAETDLGKGFTISVWTRGGMKGRWPGRYRRVDQIPYMQAWKNSSTRTCTHINHITLNTGHVRRSPRSEVADHVPTLLRPLIEDIKHGNGSLRPIPGFDGYSVASSAEDGECLIARVYANGPPAELIATIGVAPNAAGGRKLWARLHQWGDETKITSGNDCPDAPWVSAKLTKVAYKYLGAMLLLGDFERCLAWAWLERHTR